MKFKCSVNIDCPIKKVVELFKDPRYLREYQDGFIRKELISGNEGEVNAVAKMFYKHGKKEMLITETIIVNNLPDEFIGNYHHKHMDNTMKCNFRKIGENQTKYTSEIEYTAFRGFLPKLLAYLFPGLFKKQVQKWLDNFKEFVEKENV